MPKRNAEQPDRQRQVTDPVDEILLKIIDAKQKKFKVIYEEA